jgi:hypothetical protein
MITYLGESVYPNGGAPELYSIGVSLGRIPRFGGHTRDVYPVLAHVMGVARYINETHPQYALDGLLHDSQECCTMDVPTPWKTQAAKRREGMLQRRIYKSLGLAHPISEEAQEVVDWADGALLAAEANVIGHPRAKEFWAEYDELAAEITTNLLAYTKERDFTDANYAGPAYEAEYAFWHDKTNLTLPV